MLLKNNLSAPFFSKIRSLLFHMHEVLSKNSIFQNMYSKRFCGVGVCLGLFAQGFGQSTALVVYDIVQTNCANAYCHSNGTQAGGLDLEGAGNNLSEKVEDVYNKVYNVAPNNAEAAAKGHKLLYPGDPYRSHLFRKINNGLSPDVQLSSGEGSEMPLGGSISDEEIELIRQWILYGSPLGGNVVDTAVINDFYQNGGIESVPNPPAPPANGFQIHFGPFFLKAGREKEHFLKYSTDLTDSLEITSIGTTMGDYSHHFIVYRFADLDGNPTYGNNVQEGLRGLARDNFSVITTEQYSNTLALPQNTAMIFWDSMVLDLNSHYINYDASRPMKCEAYLNFETQPKGTADQIIYSSLSFNRGIYIPNSGEETVIDFSVPQPIITSLTGDNDEVFLWGIAGHTHKYGKDFDVFLTPSPFVDDAEYQIYDAGCAFGIPGCGTENFDYAHLPIRLYENFKPMRDNEYLLARTKWLNDGVRAVDWGLTSDDEMQLYTIYYLKDTTGLDLGDITSIPDDLGYTNQGVVFPNPTQEHLFFYHMMWENIDLDISIIDIKGKQVAQELFPAQGPLVKMHVGDLSPGVYLYNATDIHTGHVILDGQITIE